MVTRQIRGRTTYATGAQQAYATGGAADATVGTSDATGA